MKTNIKTLLAVSLLMATSFTTSASAYSYNCRLNCLSIDHPQGFDLFYGLTIYRDGSVYGTTAGSTIRFDATREGCIRQAKRMCDNFKIPLLPDTTLRPLREACGTIEIFSQLGDPRFPTSSNPTAQELIDGTLKIACAGQLAN